MLLFITTHTSRYFYDSGEKCILDTSSQWGTNSSLTQLSLPAALEGNNESRWYQRSLKSLFEAFKSYVRWLIAWFYWHVNLPKIISCFEVKESYSLYVYVHIILCNCFVREIFLQTFLSDSIFKRIYFIHRREPCRYYYPGFRVVLREMVVKR